MTEKKVVLVTGVADHWGSRVAARLLAKGGYHVIGLDVERPTEESHGLDFIQADILNPLLGELLKAEEVDTVCHLAFVHSTRCSETAFEANVIGMTKLLGACAEAGVRKVVLKSSTAVYGARASNPAFLTEEHSLRGSRQYGYTRDMLEIETLCAGFRRRLPDVALTVLRFASVVGPTVDTPMTRFLLDARVPSLLGFDPMMQLIHEDDVVDALVYAVLQDVPGVFNVAARDPLPLGKIRSLAGKPLRPVPHLFAYWGLRLPGNRTLPISRHLPMDPDYIRYTWVADLTRMHQVLGFQPRYTTEETVRKFAEQSSKARHLSVSVVEGRNEERLRDVIDQRHQTGEWQDGDAFVAEQGGDDE